MSQDAMEPVLTARRDGLCVDCEKKPAETNDGMYCQSCIKKLIKRQPVYDKVRDLNTTGTDQVGRPALSAIALGGMAEINDMDTDEE